MILAAVRDPFLLHSVRRAALPAEDVFSSENDVSDALQLGFPRVAVIERGIEGEVEGMLRARGSDLPVLELATLDLPGLKRSPSAIAIQRIDTAPARMRQLINEAALPVDWVEGLLRDLGRAAGHALPPELSALGRRTLEFPSRYARLDEVAEAVGLTPGALKARFRRRDLPSPFAYTTRLRALCASELLSRHDMTTARVAFHLGYSSNGNLCRAFRALTGLTLSQASTLEGRLDVLTRISREVLTPDYLRRWAALDPLFVRAA